MKPMKTYKNLNEICANLHNICQSQHMENLWNRARHLCSGQSMSHPVVRSSFGAECFNILDEIFCFLHAHVVRVDAGEFVDADLWFHWGLVEVGYRRWGPGGESAAAPTGKSFRSCVHASGRAHARREIQAYLDVLAKRTFLLLLAGRCIVMFATWTMQTSTVKHVCVWVLLFLCFANTNYCVFFNFFALFAFSHKNVH